MNLTCHGAELALSGVPTVANTPPSRTLTKTRFDSERALVGASKHSPEQRLEGAPDRRLDGGASGRFLVFDVARLNFGRCPKPPDQQGRTQ